MIRVRSYCLDAGKRRYPNRLAAESALAAAKQQWLRHGARWAPQPPDRIYRCPFCGDWHLTHRPKEETTT